MGKLLLEHHDQWYRCQLDQGKSIAIELEFDGRQPNFFGAPSASSGPLQMGQFIGDTSRGGSCNVSQIKVIPHCNGTHTETVQHIVDQKVPVALTGLEGFFLGVLVSLETVTAEQSRETYRPPLDPGDRLITAAALQAAIRPYAVSQPAALIIRTLPNVPDKLSRIYGQENPPPFMTVECLHLISRLGITHLLVDIPSIDRMNDEGKLTNHHLFWNVPENSHQLAEDSHLEKTITEFIYVDDSLADGVVLLNLQIPAFTADAAPSRPLLWPLEEVIQ